MLIPGSSEARPRASELEMREKEHMKAQTCLGARERAREKRAMKAPQHSADGAANARETQGRHSQEASHEVATEFRDVETRAQPCQRQSSATAQATAQERNSATMQEIQQNKKNKTIASVIENLTPGLEAVTQRSWRTHQTERTRNLM